MTSSATEPGKDGLARLLKEAGSAYDPDGVEALIEGVLAAPAEDLRSAAPEYERIRG